MNLLQIVQAITGELGLPQPSAVVGNTDPQIIQILALLNKTGQDLITEYEWQRLDKEYRFNTVTLPMSGTITSGSAVVTVASTTGIVAGTFMVTGNGIPADTFVLSVDSPTQITMDQNATNSGVVSLVFSQTKYVLPSDWERQINRTQWDKTNHWELMGPKTAQEWQYLKGGIVATGPRMRYRILGNTFQIWPPPIASARLGFEYLSNSWVVAMDGVTYKQLFTADTDTALFRDRLLVTGAKYEFFSQKGFDVTELGKDYDMQIETEKAGDKGAPTLSLAQQTGQMFISPGSVQDGNYPG